MKKDKILPRGIFQNSMQEYRQQHEKSNVLMQLFMGKGYNPTSVPMIDFFEPYKAWLDNEKPVYRLVDREGELLMLRSDITLFLAKKISMELATYNLPLRLCYSDSILQDIGNYDARKNASLQSGVEIIGLDNNTGEKECIVLLSNALDVLGDNETVIHIGSRTLADCIAGKRPELYTAIQSRSKPPLADIQDLDHSATQSVEQLFRFIGSSKEFTRFLAAHKLPEAIHTEAQTLLTLVESLKTSSAYERIRIDTSEIGRHSYYTGIVFSAYNQQTEQAVAQGGRYDKLIPSFGAKATPAVGFSMYPEHIHENAKRRPVKKQEESKISIAIPKGRIYQQCIQYFATKDIDIKLNEREFLIDIPEFNLRIVQVKNSDLPTYIHNGITHLGIVGTDVLKESASTFFVLGSFPFGKASLCLAAKQGTPALPSPDVQPRIATKFPNITRNFFQKQGIPVDIVHLNGAMELAPLLELTPYIVDLVETGKTLAAHNLVVLETLFETNIQLVANPAMYKVCYKEVDNLVRQIHEGNNAKQTTSNN